MKFFTMTKTVAKNLLSGPATLMYPKKKRSFFDITRGRVENDIYKCIFCGLCARRCPTYAIKVTKNIKEWQIDRLKCCTCNLCVEICPVNSLSMEIQYAPPLSEKSDAIYMLRAEKEAGGPKTGPAGQIAP
jgi:ech hydrogenase subunit F